MGQGGATTEKDAVEIGGHHLAPLLVGDFSRVAAFVDAGVVNQDVQPFKALYYGRHHGVDGVAVRDVGEMGQRELRRQILRDFGQRHFVAIHQSDTSAFGREASRGGLANTGGGAGHDDDLSFKALHGRSFRNRAFGDLAADQTCTCCPPGREIPLNAAPVPLPPWSSAISPSAMMPTRRLLRLSTGRRRTWMSPMIA